MQLDAPKGLSKLLSEFEEKSASNPSDAALVLKLGRLYIKNGSFDEAIRVYQRLLINDQGNITALLEMGLCYARLQQYAEARFNLEKALDLQPNSSSVFLAFSKLHEMMGNTEQQGAFLLRAAKAAPGRPEIRLQLAELMRRHGDLASAAKQYEAVLVINPDNETARFSLGTIFMRQNQLNEAMGHFRHIIARNPSAHDAHLNLAQCLYRQEKYGFAIPVFQAALRGYREHPQAQFLLSQCFFHLGDWDRALVIMEKLVEKFPDDVQVLMALGELYLKTNELDCARDVFFRLRKKFPERSEFAVKLAKILLGLKRYQESTNILQELFVSHPGHIDGHRLLGDLHLERKQYKDALDEYKKTLLINESYLPGYLGVAKVCAQLGDKRQEYAALQKAAAVQPRDLDILLRLGQLERDLGLPASFERFKAILAIAPQSTQGKEADYYLRYPAKARR